MKKNYMQPEWTTTAFEAEDVITASGSISYTYDPNDDLKNENVDSWTW